MPEGDKGRRGDVEGETLPAGAFELDDRRVQLQPLIPGGQSLRKRREVPLGQEPAGVADLQQLDGEAVMKPVIAAARLAFELGDGGRQGVAELILHRGDEPGRRAPESSSRSQSSSCLRGRWAYCTSRSYPLSLPARGRRRRPGSSGYAGRPVPSGGQGGSASQPMMKSRSESSVPPHLGRGSN